MIENTTSQTEQKKLPILAIINSGRVDGDKDRYYLQGINTERFMKNPVMILNHQRTELPVGRWKNIRITNEGLVGELEFYESEIGSEHSQLCLTIKDMVEKGFLKGVSLTARDIEVIPNQYGGYDILKSELIEISLVTIPSDENALIKGY